MIRRFFIYLSLIVFLTVSSFCLLFVMGLAKVAVPFPVSEPPPRGVILLVPLDSRPPCTDYVTRLASMAGFRTLLPPAELLDNYRQPGNAAGMREWLKQNISRADAAIISVDMLAHGGLLASRKGIGAAQAAEEVAGLLTVLHQNQPQVRLYAFSIIPRLLISDDPYTEKYKQPMTDWSMLQETAALFENPADIRRLQALEASIPADIPARYRALYAGNQRMNQQLIALTRDGVISGLVLGQDDSAPFGLGNMERQRLESELANHPELNGKIFLTRGTDEVALTLLDPATRSNAGSRHKVYVHYTDARAADAILPYMPRPLARTVEEKLAISGADSTQSLSEADYLLVIHAGDSHSGERQLAAEADRIRAWIEAGYNVALVDLATDWSEEQTLLPRLLRNNTPLHRLIAYAGWNTASNSVGTAVTQAAMVLRGRNTEDFAVALYRDAARAGFLGERILDDWYYQKILRPQLNDELKNLKIDPYDLKQARQAVTRQISHQVYNAYVRYLRWGWRDAVFPLTPRNLGSYVINGWKIRSGLPWDRTFEIFIGAEPAPARIIDW